MTNFTKTPRSPGILARLAAFGKMFTPKRDYDPVLHRYARNYYLEHYCSRFNTKFSSYLIQLAISGITIFVAYGHAFGESVTTNMSVVWVVCAIIVIAVLALIHSIDGIIQRYSDAAKFADDAMLSAETRDDVAEFFRETYPFIISAP